MYYIFMREIFLKIIFDFDNIFFCFYKVVKK